MFRIASVFVIALVCLCADASACDPFCSGGFNSFQSFSRFDSFGGHCGGGRAVLFDSGFNSRSNINVNVFDSRNSFNGRSRRGSSTVVRNSSVVRVRR